jgi:hypothetical protein
MRTDTSTVERSKVQKAIVNRSARLDEVNKFILPGAIQQKKSTGNCCCRRTDEKSKIHCRLRKLQTEQQYVMNIESFK